MGNKQSFWVIKRDKLEFIEGEIKIEEEGSWSEGMERFHGPNKDSYCRWFNSPEEALRDKLESVESMYKFNKEMIEVELKNLEEKRINETNHWTKLLEEYNK